MNVNKPPGISSFDVIRRVQHELRTEPGDHPVPAAGHAGTLDPMASGVLLVLLGEATKLSRFIMAQTKTYDAEVTFGASTDTDDTTGAILDRQPVPNLSFDGLQAALAPFVGQVEQVPPAYSAIKQDGQTLYKLARKGKPVAPRPRTVTVHSLVLVDWKPPTARLRCVVSSGTYIRALARDLGASLVSAAALSGLVRTRVGRFAVEDAVGFEGLSRETIRSRAVPVEDAVPDLKVIDIDRLQGQALRFGKAVRDERADGMTDVALARVADGSALFLVQARDGNLQPRRLVYAD